jgi:hypothetical protein
MVTQCAENPATAGSDKVDTAEADESQQDGVIRQQLIEQLRVEYGAPRPWWIGHPLAGRTLIRLNEE